ncbi:MAG: Fic family protein [Proteobacteria bacterium]|nr:Fic family protein [Pseudomonadota bacterium]
MESNQKWIWQHRGWPDFTYDAGKLLPELTALSRLMGGLEMTCRTLAVDSLLDARAQVLTEDALETSAIEGEMLRRSSVRASARKRLGLPVDHDASDRRTDDLVAMLMDARENTGGPLTEEMLFAWHAALFPTGYSGLNKIRVGAYRGKEPMQIISGPITREKVHYLAPPGSGVAAEMARFLQWVNSDNRIDSLLKAGIAHLWFIMIHPFDDGNGRVGRAITDYLLSMDFPLPIQVISFSRHVRLDQKGYYHILEETGKQGLDINGWLLWFFKTLSAAIDESRWIIDQVVQKAAFWNLYGEAGINDRQRKVLNKLLDAGERFEGFMTTRKYAGMTKCSKVTASRDLKDLEEKGLVQRRPGSGRSTSYEIKKNSGQEFIE